MDWVRKHIDEINKFLKVRPGEELTLPNENARRLARTGFYSKLFKDADNDQAEEENQENNENKLNTNNLNSKQNHLKNLDDKKDENENN